MDALNLNHFKGVHMNDTPDVEDLLTLKILLYDIIIVEGNIIGELATRSAQKNKTSVLLLRYNNHICYACNINAVFQPFCCPNCDIFSKRTINLERKVLTCSERVKKIYPRNVYEIRTIMFDKLDSFGITYTSEQKLFKKFSNIRLWIDLCLERDLQRHTNNNLDGITCPDICVHFVTPWQWTNFLCNSDPHYLFQSFIGPLEGVVLKNKTQMKLLFLDIDTTIKIKLGRILEKLNQRHNWWE